jgi:ABC-type branched-subunit amino acid transport system ATPase component
MNGFVFMNSHGGRGITPWPTILLAEQKIELALGLASRIYVIDHGAVAFPVGQRSAPPLKIQERNCAM